MSNPTDMALRERIARVEKQRDTDDCTICAIAALTGLPYERVMAVAAATQGGYRYGGTLGTMSPKAVLLALGFTAERIPGAYIKSRVLWGRRAILSLPSLNGFDGHHDVYWDGRGICDPSNGLAYPRALGDATVTWAVVVDEILALPLTSPGVEWPDVSTLTMPRNAKGEEPDPVLDALAQFAAPWNLTHIAGALRQGGVKIPTRVEAEYAAAAHFLIGHALRSGANWKEAALADLEARALPHPPASSVEGGER